MAKSYRPANEIERAFIKAFDTLCYRHNPWTVWTDFINMYACAISTRYITGRTPASEIIVLRYGFWLVLDITVSV